MLLFGVYFLVYLGDLVNYGLCCFVDCYYCSVVGLLSCWWCLVVGCISSGGVWWLRACVLVYGLRGLVSACRFSVDRLISCRLFVIFGFDYVVVCWFVGIGG